MSSSNASFEDELADVESLATLVDLRKDTKGHEKHYTDLAIRVHINALLSKGTIAAVQPNAKRIRLLQSLIHARRSMEMQNMDISKIDDLVFTSLRKLLFSRPSRTTVKPFARTSNHIYINRICINLIYINPICSTYSTICTLPICILPIPSPSSTISAPPHPLSNPSQPPPNPPTNRHPQQPSKHQTKPPFSAPPYKSAFPRTQPSPPPPLPKPYLPSTKPILHQSPTSPSTNPFPAKEVVSPKLNATLSQLAYFIPSPTTSTLADWMVRSMLTVSHLFSLFRTSPPPPSQHESQSQLLAPLTPPSHPLHNRETTPFIPRWRRGSVK